MASDVEASCLCDPNFAVICSFLEKFAKSCGITYPNFSKLQEMFENTVEVPQTLIDLHVKLLRKARKSVSGERWEKAFIKFCHTYSSQDGWEIERFGYKKARLGVKLRLLKSLLEIQFDLNGRFKTEINRLNADELRVQPIGRDKLGQAYWSQLDEDCNLRVYREDLDDENWDIVARDREGLVQLITQLSSNEPFNSELENLLNEDSNSQDIEKPITDTGQVDDSASTDDDGGGEFEEIGEEEGEEAEDEEEDEEGEEEEDSAEEDEDVKRMDKSKNPSLVNPETVLNSSEISCSAETKQQAKLLTKDGRLKQEPKYQSSASTYESENNQFVDTERVVKPFKIDLSKHNMQKKKTEAGLNLSKDDSLGMDLSSKKGLEISQSVCQLKSNVIKAESNHLNFETLQDDIDTVCDLTTKNTQYMKKQEEVAKHSPVALQNSEQNVATDLCIRNLPNISVLPSGGAVNNLKTIRTSGKRDFKQVDPKSPTAFKRTKREELGSVVGEAIEEPLMLVRGEGSGNNCDTGNPGKSSDSSETVDKSKTEKSKTSLEGEHTDKLPSGSGKDDFNTTGSMSSVNCLNKSADLSDESNNNPVGLLSGCDVNKNKGAIINSQTQNQSDRIEDNPNYSSESNVVQDKSAKEYVNIKLKRVHSFEGNNESVGPSSARLDDATLVHGKEIPRTDSIFSSSNKLPTMAADKTIESRIHTNVSVLSTTEKSGRSSEAPLPATKRYLHSSTNLSQTKSGGEALKCGPEISPTKLCEKTPPKLWSIDNICAPDGKADSADTSKSTNRASAGVESTVDRTPKVLLGVQLPPKSVHPLKRSSRWDVGKPSDNVTVSYEHSAPSCKDNVSKQLPAPLSHDTVSLKSEMVKESVPQPYKDLATVQGTEDLNLGKQEYPRLERSTSSPIKSFEDKAGDCKVEGDQGLSTKPSQRFFFGPGCLQFPGMNKLSAVPPVSVKSIEVGSTTENKTKKLNQLTSKVQSETSVIIKETKSLTDDSLSKSCEKSPSISCTSRIAKASETQKKITPALNETNSTEDKTLHSSETQEGGKSTKDGSPGPDVETSIGINRSSEAKKSPTQTNTVVPPSGCKADKSPSQQSSQDTSKKREIVLENVAKRTLNISSLSDVDRPGNDPACMGETNTLIEPSEVNQSMTKKCSKSSLSSAHYSIHNKFDSTTLAKKDLSCMKITTSSGEVTDSKSFPTKVGSDTKTCTLNEELKSVGENSSSSKLFREITQTGCSKVSDAYMSAPIHRSAINTVKIIPPTSEGKLSSEAVLSQGKQLVEVTLKSSSKSTSENTLSVTSETTNTSEGKESLVNKNRDLKPAVKSSVEAATYSSKVLASVEDRGTGELQPINTKEDVKSKAPGDLPVSTFSAKLDGNKGTESKLESTLLTTQLCTKDNVGGKHLQYPTVPTQHNQIRTMQQSSKLESSTNSDRSKQTGHSSLGATSVNEPNSSTLLKSSAVTLTIESEQDEFISKNSVILPIPQTKEILESKLICKPPSTKEPVQLTPTKKALKTEPTDDSSRGIKPLNEETSLKPIISGSVALSTITTTKPEPSIESLGKKLQSKELIGTTSLMDSTGTSLLTKETETKSSKDCMSLLPQGSEPIVTTPSKYTSSKDSSGIKLPTQDSIELKPTGNTGETISPVRKISDNATSHESTATVRLTTEPISTKLMTDPGSANPSTKKSIGTNPLKDSINASPKTKEVIGIKPLNDYIDSIPRTEVGLPIRTKPLEDSISTATAPQINNPFRKQPSMVCSGSTSQAKELIGTKPSKDSIVKVPSTKDSKDTKLIDCPVRSQAKDSTLTPQTNPPIATSGATSQTNDSKEAKPKDGSVIKPQTKQPILTAPFKASSVTVPQIIDFKQITSKDSIVTIPQTKELIGTKLSINANSKTAETKDPIVTKWSLVSNVTTSGTKDFMKPEANKNSSDTVLQSKESIETKPAKDSSVSVLQAKELIGRKPLMDSSGTTSQTKNSLDTKPKDCVTIAQTKESIETKPSKDSSDMLTQTKPFIPMKPSKESTEAVTKSTEAVETKPSKESSDAVHKSAEPVEIKPSKECSDAVHKSAEPVGMKPSKESSDAVHKSAEPVTTKSSKESSEAVTKSTKPVETIPSKKSSDAVTKSTEPVETKLLESIDAVHKSTEPVKMKPSKESDAVPKSTEAVETKPSKESSDAVHKSTEPVETKPSKESTDAVPKSTEPVETKLPKESDAVPKSTEPAETKPSKESSDAVPKLTEPVETKPLKESSEAVTKSAEPVKMKPLKQSSEAVPKSTEPVETKPPKESSEAVPKLTEPVKTKPSKESSDAVGLPKGKEPVGMKPSKYSSVTVSQTKERAGTKPSSDSSVIVQHAMESVGAKPSQDSSVKGSQAKQPVGTKPSSDSSVTVQQANEPVGTKPSNDSNVTVPQAKEPVGTKPSSDCSVIVQQANESVGAKPSKDSSVTGSQAKEPVGTKPSKDSIVIGSQAKESVETKPSKDSSVIGSQAKESVETKPSQDSSVTGSQAKESVETKPSKDSSVIGSQAKESVETNTSKDSSKAVLTAKEQDGTKPSNYTSVTIPQTKDSMEMKSKDSCVTIPQTKDSMDTKPNDSCVTIPQTKYPNSTTRDKDSYDKSPQTTESIKNTVAQAKEPIATKSSKDLAGMSHTEGSVQPKELIKVSLTTILPKDILETNSKKKLTEQSSAEELPNMSPKEKHVITTQEIKECNAAKLSRHPSTIIEPTKDFPVKNNTTSSKSVEQESPVNTVSSIKETTNRTLHKVGFDREAIESRGYQLFSNKPDPPVMALDLTDTTAKTASLSKESAGDKDLTKESVTEFKTRPKSSEPTLKPIETLIPAKESVTGKLVYTREICPAKDTIISKSLSKESIILMKEDSSTMLLPNKPTDNQPLQNLSTESKSTLNEPVKPTQEGIGTITNKKELSLTSSTTNEFIKLKPIGELLVAKTSVAESTVTTPCKDKPIGHTSIVDTTISRLVTNEPLVGKSNSDKESIIKCPALSEKTSNVDELTSTERSDQVYIAGVSTLQKSTVEKLTTEACKDVDLSLPEEVGLKVTLTDKSIEPETADKSAHPVKEISDDTPSKEITKSSQELINTKTQSLGISLSKDSVQDKVPCSKESNDQIETRRDTSTSDSTSSDVKVVPELPLIVESRKLKPMISVRNDLSIKKSKIDDTSSLEVASVETDTSGTEITNAEKMEDSTEINPVQTRRKGKSKNQDATEPEAKLVEVSKVADEPKPTILGLSLDYNPIENVPKVTTRPKLKVKKIETLMEVNTNSLETDDNCQPAETDPLADYDDLIPVTVTRGKKNAPLPPPPPVVKRKRRSIENEADEGGKRARQQGKEVISDDEVLEEQLLSKRKGRGRPPKGETKKPPPSPKITRGRSKRVSSTESTDKDIQTPKKAESKPSKGLRGRRKQVLVAKESSSDGDGNGDGDDIGIDLVCGASSEDSMPVAKKQTPVKAKPTPRKTRRVLGLEVPVDLDESGASSGLPPMRQSRRIAQIKIKEEAERRQLEEMTLTVLKHEQREKHAHKADKPGDKKKKLKSISDEYSAEEDEQDEDFGSSKKQKKKRKKREKKWTQKDFDESKPWQSSSGSSTSQEEEEEELGDQSEDDERIISTVLKSDHEFSPESDLEDGTLDAQPTRLARTAQKVEPGVQDAVDDAACQKCKASDHPEWILLCDKCDTGWHASCLRPALLVIPEGDWYCPPCQHTALIVRLHEQLREVDRSSKRRDNEELRKKRLAYVGISLGNVLTTKETKEDVTGSQEESGRESGPAEGSSGSSRSGSDSGDESEPIYQLRERRAALFSYRFNEYDDLINSAIQDELEAVNGAGNQGRGKDIATIVNAEKEESGQKKNEEVEGAKENKGDNENEAEPEVEEEEEEDGYIPPVKKFATIKKKHRKLNSLDISSEDDPESDEDFKGSSSEGDEEDYEEDADSDDSEMRGRRGRGSSGPVRRSARARTTRFDREFIDDDNSDGSDAPRSRGRKKKVRRAWDETSESEESDSTWGQAPKRPRQAPRTHAPRSSESKKKKSKKKKRVAEGSDIEVYKASKPKKPRVKYGGLDEPEDVYTARRTRGCKINYVEMGGTDSEEEKFFKSSRTKKLESEEEDEYVVNEEDEMMLEMEEEGKETENESAEEEQVPDPEPHPQPAPEPEPAPELAPISEPSDQQALKAKVEKIKINKGKGKTGVKKSKNVKKVEPLIIATTGLVEESDDDDDDEEEEEEEEEDEEEEEEEEEEDEVEEEVEEEEEDSLSMVEEFEPPEPVINEAELVKEQKRLKKEVKKLEKKEQKKRGKRKESVEVASSETMPREVVTLPAPVMDSPAKRKGRGRGKAALAKAAAAADVSPVPPPGNSVISRMLQSRPVAPARSFADAASVMGQKYFGDQLLARGMPTSPRPPFLPMRGRHPSPYRQPRSPGGVPPYPGPRPGRPPIATQMYHTSHHPLDPSPSGGGPIAIAADGTPPKHSHGTPPPPYGRSGPLGRFTPDIIPAPNGGSPLRHPSSHFAPAAQSASPGRSPAPNNFTSYHPPPNYHYGAYPMGSEDALPPAAYQGSSYPETYTSSPLQTSESSNSKPMEEEGSGEFGGLVSYFSSQREDDLDA